jgi:hypothetical protein
LRPPLDAQIFFARRFDRPPNVLHSFVDVSEMADWLAPAPFAIRTTPVCSDSHLILFPGISCTAGAAVPQARSASHPRLAAHIISGERITGVFIFKKKDEGSE